MKKRIEYVVQIESTKDHWFDSAQNAACPQILKQARKVFTVCKELFGNARIVRREFKDTVVETNRK